MRRGFTLMEVFLAIVVVGAVVVALASMIPLAMESMGKGQTAVTASNLARQYLDWWKQQDFATLKKKTLLLPPSVAYIDPLPPGVPVPAPPSPQQYGSLEPTVSDVRYQTQVVFSPTADPDVIQIDVYVDWQSGGFAGRLSRLGAGTSEVHYATCVYHIINPW